MDDIIFIQGGESSTLTPLFLIHAVSGLALPYLGLGSLTHGLGRFGQDRAVYGLNSPIYANKEYQLPRSLDEVARQYISIIKREVQPRGPYLLGGWSLGGVIALKMASILEARGESVLHVVMIDSPNPEIYPAFVNRAEHDQITALTYGRVVGRMNTLNPPLDDNGASSSDTTDDDESEDEISLATTLPRMRKHISNSLHLISSVLSSNHFLPDCYLEPVTLVKCSLLSRPAPTLRDVRKAFVQETFHDERMGWQSTGFKRFRTIRFRAQHDSAFDKMHVEELTGIMRGILADVP
ncbi:MAG: hypothetical protein L6R42_000184 [Xanthoria sp. 1 TBL-2021]|nr:MAG: hypothetical protein L6R42_000184 [Xanthoria sp. 1 TBL-2021]